MWWSKKDSQSGGDDDQKKVPPTPENAKVGKFSAAQQLSAKFRRRKTGDAALTASMSEESTCVDVSSSAIEISLANGEAPPSAGKSPRKSSQNGKDLPPSEASKNPAHRECAPFSSVSDVLAERRKVYRAQFAIADWKSKSTPMTSQNVNPNATVLADFEPRNHRVPLFGNEQRVDAKNSVLVQDAIALLQQHDVTDELECVKQELSLLDIEISALQADRDDIEKSSMRVAISASDTQEGEKPPIALHWEISRKLLKGNLSDSDRKSLQEARGSSLTVSLHSKSVRDAFFSYCGYKPSGGSSKTSSFVTLSPHFCATDGAASTIQHISLLMGLPEVGFLLSRDESQSSFYGRLPNRLFRRMQAHGMNPKSGAGEILYLSSGPLGCYYVEFRSGDCWWGTSVDDNQEDDEFCTICREWDVSRVVFGPGDSIEDPSGHVYRATSWIILARNGRAAWKNIPSRLHQLLEGRMASEAAPAEVALGYGDSYFVRFLDGTVDYCLPAHVADVIEKRQLDVTSVYLHSGLAQDVVLRHL